MFKCKACAAKDDEINWLRHELEVERRTRAEAAKPGITRAVEPQVWDAAKPPEVATEPPKPPEPTFPGYEPAPPRGVEVT